MIAAHAASSAVEGAHPRVGLTDMDGFPARIETLDRALARLGQQAGPMGGADDDLDILEGRRDLDTLIRLRKPLAGAGSEVDGDLAVSRLDSRAGGLDDPRPSPAERSPPGRSGSSSAAWTRESVGHARRRTGHAQPGHR